MPLQSRERSGASVIANAAAAVGVPHKGAGSLPLCDLLYSSWGGAPPMCAADMQKYERWRCRTLALRSLSSCQCAPAGSEKPGGTSSREPTNNKLDGIEEQEAMRAEGFALLRRCLPKGLPMDLIERTAWAACLSFFCRWGSCSCLRGSLSEASTLQPVSLPSLVARLARRLWFLIPGTPHLLAVSSGGASLLEMLPPWASFFCEEIAAFFLFVLLHMAALIYDGNGVYVHLTDREWSARFRHLKYLLTLGSSPPLPPSSTFVEGSTENASLQISRDDTTMFPVGGGRGQLDLPPIECIDISLSQHFPMNPQSASHSFWLLFDRRSLSWVVCTESYALRSFCVLDNEAEGAPQDVLSGKGSGMKHRRRPLPSLVDAAKEDALRFLSLLGALAPSSLSGNTAYLDSLQSDLDTEASFLQQQQQQQLVLPDVAPEWTDESLMHSEVSPKCEPPGISLDGPQQEDHKRRDSEGPAVAAACIEETGVMLQLQGLQPAGRAEEETEEAEKGSVRWQATSGGLSHSGSRAATAEDDSEAEVQVFEGPPPVQEDRDAQAPFVDVECSAVAASQKRKNTHQGEPQRRHKRQKQQEPQKQKQQPQQQKTKKQQRHKGKQQHQYPGLQGVLDGLLQGGKKVFCGGRVLVGLRHRNALLDVQLASFCRFHLNGSTNKTDNHITEQECLAALQGYMQQHCERQKRVYLCDEKLKALTGRERLPYQRETLAKALKSCGLIEHFMIDPRDLKDA